MKQLYIIAAAIIMASCTSSQPEEPDQAKQAVESFVRERIPLDIKTLEVQEPDSVLSDSIVRSLSIRYQRMRDGYLSGDITRDQLTRFCDTVFLASRLIRDSEHNTQQMDTLITDWFLAYPVYVELTDGTHDIVRVIMSQDRTTPRDFIGPYMEDVSNLEKEIRDDLLTLITM